MGDVSASNILRSIGTLDKTLSKCRPRLWIAADTVRCHLHCNTRSWTLDRITHIQRKNIGVILFSLLIAVFPGLIFLSSQITNDGLSTVLFFITTAVLLAGIVLHRFHTPSVSNEDFRFIVAIIIPLFAFAIQATLELHNKILGYVLIAVYALLSTVVVITLCV